MSNNYKLSLAFCAVDETDLLKDAFEKTYANNDFSECVFVLSQSCTAECLDTVKELCLNNGCRYVFQSDKGLGNAIRTVFDEVSGTHLIIWPSDDGMDAGSLKKMIDISKNNPQKIVKVSRWLSKNGFSNYGTIRKMINGISQKLFAVMFSSSLTDFTNPTQIAPVEMYRKIKWDNNGFYFIPEMIFKPLRSGYEFIEVPCSQSEKREGKNHSNLPSLIKYYSVIFKIRRTKASDLMLK